LKNSVDVTLANLRLEKLTNSSIKFSGINESVSFTFGSSSGVLEVTGVEYELDGKRSLIDVPSVTPTIIGSGATKRSVFHFLDKQYVGNRGLRAGITIHGAKSQWSSLPHDFELNLEAGFEEVFFYGLKSEEIPGAIQIGRGVWHDMSPVDDCWFVGDRESSIIPMGYHPVVGLPGTTVSYCWAYIAKHPHWEKVKQ
jgi:5-deoxy-D-glucuronate isomerase